MYADICIRGELLFVNLSNVADSSFVLLNCENYVCKCAGRLANFKQSNQSSIWVVLFDIYNILGKLSTHFPIRTRPAESLTQFAKVSTKSAIRYITCSFIFFFNMEQLPADDRAKRRAEGSYDVLLAK